MNYVFDIDGTLSFNGTTIAPVIVDALKELESQGNQLIFASARPIRDLLPIIPDFAHQHLLIGGNGAIVQTKNNQLEIVDALPNSSTDLLKVVINQYGLNYIVDSAWDYAADVNENRDIYRQLDPAHLAQKVDLNQIHQAIKIILIDIPHVVYSEILERLKQVDTLELVEHSGEASIDITAKAINKYSTLMTYENAPYIAFGNDHNDFELLHHAQKSVWVGGMNERLANSVLDSDYLCAAEDESVSELIKAMI